MVERTLAKQLFLPQKFHAVEDLVCCGAADLCLDRAVSQTRANYLARAGSGGGSQQNFVGAAVFGAVLDIDQCVATIQHGQRRQSIEAGSGAD